MHPITALLYQLIDLYILILIIWVILSLLIQFKVVNAYQPVVQKVNFVLYRLTEPVLGYMRKVIPPIGGIDLSPVVLIIALQFIQNSLVYYF